MTSVTQSQFLNQILDLLSVHLLRFNKIDESHVRRKTALEKGLVSTEGTIEGGVGFFR